MKVQLNIKRAMQDVGMTLKELSKRSGLTSSNIVQFTNPTLKNIMKVADGLGIDPRDLFYSVDDDGNVISHVDENTSRTNVAVSQAISQYAAMLEERDKRIADLESELAILKLTSSGHDALSSSDVQKSSLLPGTEMPVGSVVPAYKAYVCPHCGTKFAIFDEK